MIGSSIPTLLLCFFKGFGNLFYLNSQTSSYSFCKPAFAAKMLFRTMSLTFSQIGFFSILRNSCRYFQRLVSVHFEPWSSSFPVAIFTRSLDSPWLNPDPSFVQNLPNLCWLSSSSSEWSCCQYVLDPLCTVPWKTLTTVHNGWSTLKKSPCKALVVKIDP